MFRFNRYGGQSLQLNKIIENKLKFKRKLLILTQYLQSIAQYFQPAPLFIE